MAINHRLAGPEVEYILQHSGARFLLVDAALDWLVKDSEVRSARRRVGRRSDAHRRDLIEPAGSV